MPFIPQILLVEVLHTPGSLAQVLQVVGDVGITVDGLDAISKTQDKTTWELSIEIDEENQDHLCDAIDALEIAHVKGVSDRVFVRHEGGKIETGSRVPLDNLQTLRDVYTPGVARVCLAIQENPALAQRYTNIPKTVAIVTNGTAILGLGDIGPVAGLPVMEGKAALFNTFAGLSGVPILIDSKDSKHIINVVEAIAPSFGAIQIEDIGAPECFEIESTLIDRLNIPVLHDDQHGTAVVVLAALMSAARMTGAKIEGSVIGQVGLGAAGIGISKLLLHYGAKTLLGADLSEEALAHQQAEGGTPSTLQEVMETADIVVATTGVKGLIKPESVRPGQIIFALSNPEPEIEPTEALARGAKFAADGKNINNVLAFPGLFRGALGAGATRFTNAMLIAASKAISESAPEGALIPSSLDQSAHDAVAAAVAAATT